MTARSKKSATKPPKEPFVRQRPFVKRKPSLSRALQQAYRVGRQVTAAKVGPDGTIVLQFKDNLDDSHAPTNKSVNPWDEVLKQ